MVTTEAQAREKVCPRLIHMDRAAARCIAKDCMAWRWKTGAGAFTKDDTPQRNGYCGLGGVGHAD